MENRKIITPCVRGIEPCDREGVIGASGHAQKEIDRDFKVLVDNIDLRSERISSAVEPLDEVAQKIVVVESPEAYEITLRVHPVSLHFQETSPGIGAVGYPLDPLRMAGREAIGTIATHIVAASGLPKGEKASAFLQDDAMEPLPMISQAAGKELALNGGSF